MFKFKKAQISLEILVVILLLIVFLHIYTSLSQINADSLEINKIKEQQVNIALEINYFLKVQDGIFSITNNNYSDLENSFKVPNILSASKKTDCRIDVNSTHTQVYSSVHGGVLTILNNNLTSTNFELPKVFYCNQEIVCNLNSTKIDCN